MQQFEEDDDQDRQATLLHGMTLLEPDMTVVEAGLEDAEDISILWSDPFVEMAEWTGEKMDGDLYVRIPPHVTHIDDLAFYFCIALVKIVIPDAVRSIGEEAFHGCSFLTQVEIPKSVTRIGHSAFFDCSSLTQVEIPNSVSNIGRDAFSGCSLSEPPQVRCGPRPLKIARNA